MNSIICSWKKNGILATILLSLFSWILLTWHIIQIALHLILIMFWLLFVLKKQLMLRARKIQLDIGNNNDKCRFFERNEYSHYMKFWSIRLSSIFFFARTEYNSHEKSVFQYLDLLFHHHLFLKKAMPFAIFYSQSVRGYHLWSK